MDITFFLSNVEKTFCCTVKLGDKERFDRNKLVLRNHFPWPNANLLHKDKEHLALRNNFRVTKKFLLTSSTAGMSQRGEAGGSFPPRFWQIRRRRRAVAARRITTCPPGFLTLAASLKLIFLNEEIQVIFYFQNWLNFRFRYFFMACLKVSES